MKAILKFTWALLFFCFTVPGFAQELPDTKNRKENKTKLRPIRIGAKLGFPNLIGGNVEYVTPLLNHKLAVFIDYSKLSSDFLNDLVEENAPEAGDTDEYDFSYFEGGLNYYFFKPGYGLYGGVSYGAISIGGTLQNVESNNDPNKTGTGTIDFTNNSFNVKLGAKLGGLFYFRPEVGYSFNALPNSVPVEVNFPNGTSESQIEEFDSESSPQNLLFKGFMINIGIGFAF